MTLHELLEALSNDIRICVLDNDDPRIPLTFDFDKKYLNGKVVRIDEDGNGILDIYINTQKNSVQFELDELFEKYSTWLLDEEEHLEGNKELIKKAIDFDKLEKAYNLIQDTNYINIRIHILKNIIDDLESLRS